MAKDAGESKICTLDLINNNRTSHWACFKNICIDVQYVTLQKYFSHPSFVLFFQLHT